MSTDPESVICAAVTAILTAGVPEVDGRVVETDTAIFDKRYLPCLLVTAGLTQVETPEQGNPGRRPQTRTLILSVYVNTDATASTPAEATASQQELRAIGLKVEQALMADPALKAGGSLPRATNLVLASHETTTVEQAGTVIGLRRYDIVVTYRTHEMNPAEIVVSRH